MFVKIGLLSLFLTAAFSMAGACYYRVDCDSYETVVQDQWGVRVAVINDYYGYADWPSTVYYSPLYYRAGYRQSHYRNGAYLAPSPFSYATPTPQVIVVDRPVVQYVHATPMPSAIPTYATPTPANSPPAAVSGVAYPQYAGKYNPWYYSAYEGYGATEPQLP